MTSPYLRHPPRDHDDALSDTWDARIHSGRCLSCGSVPAQTPEGRCHPCNRTHRDAFEESKNG